MERNLVFTCLAHLNHRPTMHLHFPASGTSREQGMHALRLSRFARILCLALVLLAQVPLFAFKTTTAYLKEMPSVEEVERAIQGTDAVDTRLRRIGAYKQLKKMIGDVLCGDREFELSREERALRDRYHSAEVALDEALRAEKIRYNPSQYEYDEELRKQVFGAFFSEKFVKHYHECVAKKEEERASFAAAQQQQVAEADRMQEAEMQERLRQRVGEVNERISSLRIAFLATIGAVLLFVLATRRWRKVRLVSTSEVGDELRFQYGKKDIQVTFREGIVASFQKVPAQRVEGSDGIVLNSPARVEFFLVAPGDKEAHWEMTGVDLAVRDGHVLSMAGYKSGDMFYPLVIKNHTTGDTYDVHPNLNKLFVGPKRQTIGCGLAGGLIIGLAGMWLSLGDKTGLFALWMFAWLGVGLLVGLISPRSPDMAAIKEFKKALTFPVPFIRPA